MELEVSLPCSQQPASGPYPEPDERLMNYWKNRQYWG